MITVDNKFEIGQEVFVVIKEKRMINTKQTCGMCLGEGKIMYRGYKSICPMCNGLKELNLESKKRNIYTVDPIPHVIVSFRYSVTKEGNFLRYRLGNASYNNKNVTENKIFATLEEAEARCKELNKKDS